MFFKNISLSKIVLPGYLASVRFMLHLHVVVLFTLSQTTPKVRKYVNRTVYGLIVSTHCHKHNFNRCAQAYSYLKCSNRLTMPRFCSFLSPLLPSTNRKEPGINESTRINGLESHFPSLVDFLHVTQN